jgi:hypothetical protein
VDICLQPTQYDSTQPSQFHEDFVRDLPCLLLRDCLTHPAPARGYLRPMEGYRLFEQREELCRRLKEDVTANREWLLDTLQYPTQVK